MANPSTSESLFSIVTLTVVRVGDLVLTRIGAVVVVNNFRLPLELFGESTFSNSFPLPVVRLIFGLG